MGLLDHLSTLSLVFWGTSILFSTVTTLTYIPTSVGGFPFCTPSPAQNIISYVYRERRGFPDGPVVKNQPCNARDAGSVAGPGRSHVRPGSWACESQLQHPHAATTEAREPGVPTAQQEKPLQWEACAWKLESGPHSLQLEKTHMQRQRPSMATKRIFKKYKREERIVTGHSLYMHVLHKPCKNAMGLALLSLFHMLETETDWVSCYSGVKVELRFHCIIQSPKIKNSLGNFHSAPPPMF